MLRAYFDDTGTHEDSRVVGWAGLIGTDEQWASLQEPWAALLAEPLAGKPPIKMLHASHARSHWGEFEDYTATDCDHLFWRFRQVIIQSGVGAIGYMADREAFDREMPDELKVVLGSAEALCLGGCIKSAMEAAACDGHLGLVIAVDKGRAERQTEIIELIERVEGNYEAPFELDAFEFLSAKATFALQAADLIAAENYWQAMDVVSGGAGRPRLHFQNFLDNNPADGFFLGPAEIAETVGRFQREGRRALFERPV